MFSSGIDLVAKVHVYLCLLNIYNKQYKENAKFNKGFLTPERDVLL